MLLTRRKTLRCDPKRIHGTKFCNTNTTLMRIQVAYICDKKLQLSFPNVSRARGNDVLARARILGKRLFEYRERRFLKCHARASTFRQMKCVSGRNVRSTSARAAGEHLFIYSLRPQIGPLAPFKTHPSDSASARDCATHISRIIY